MRLPPPFFEKKLRPSSACRASAENIMNTRRSASADGSSTTVYLPGSIALGFFERAAFSIAAVASLPGSSSRSSLNDLLAQPDPVPSGVRDVRL